MKQVVIENPVINSPFREPGRHFKFTDEGITNEVIDGRRSSSYFVPIARPRKKGQKQLEFDTEWTQDRIEENKLVNQIRARVKLWREGKCHLVADTDSWEQKLAQALEEMDEVVRYVKNHNLGFMIPYSLGGEGKNYVPDFIACINDGHGSDDLLNLLIEVTGEKKKDKAAKVTTARTLWVPAVNNHGGFGRWAFVEIDDPRNAMTTIRSFLEGKS